MNDQDKPIGAPDISTHQEAYFPTAPEKPKRKLHWKAFFIGIVIVIIIEFIAISMIRSGDPEIPIAPPADPTNISGTIQPSPTN